MPNSITEEQIVLQLKTIKYPGFSRDIVSFGLVKKITVADGAVTVEIGLNTTDKAIPQFLREQTTAALLALPGVTAVQIDLSITAPHAAAAAALPQNEIPGVRHVIAVGSGKGGVGKSTVAANLALALSQQKHRVGLCDCDIYGPSIPLMFGTSEAPYVTEDNRILPVARFGLKLMSMGFLLADESPAILRGPMVTRYTQQFLRNVDWGELDYLILDLPPGTGDIQLTIVQTVALAGAVVVTTPQEVALIDARKAVAMFTKVNVRVLGLIENMSYFLCPQDQNRYDIFGTGGGQREADRLGVPLLAEIPLEIATRQSGDAGLPLVQAQPGSLTGKLFHHAARKIIETTDKMPSA